MAGDNYVSTKEKRDIAYAFIDAHPAMSEPDRMLAFAEEQNAKLVKALERLKNCVFTEQTGEKLQAIQQADEALTAAGRKP